MDTIPSNQPQNPPVPVQNMGTPSTAKELEHSPKPAESPSSLTEVGEPSPLSPEVTRAGVRMQPVTVEIPKTVAQLGVKPVGAHAAPPPRSIALPLTDDQIAQGLNQSIGSSWRWLAEWCQRRLKELHLMVRSLGGKAVREPA